MCHRRQEHLLQRLQVPACGRHFTPGTTADNLRSVLPFEPQAARVPGWVSTAFGSNQADYKSLISLKGWFCHHLTYPFLYLLGFLLVNIRLT